MSKRIILLTLILTLVFSLFSCQQAEEVDNTTQTTESDALADALLEDRSIADTTHCEVFVGKILKKEKIEESVRFENIFTTQKGESSQYLYTVKVKETYATSLVSEGTTIKVFQYSLAKNSSGIYANELEVGEKYILSGMVQPYEGEPIIALVSDMLAHVSWTGKITPYSYVAERLYEGIETVKELKANESFIELCNSEETSYIVSLFFAEDNEQNIDSDNQLTADSSAQLKPTREQVIETIREALKVDSDVKMNIDYDNTPDDTE